MIGDRFQRSIKLVPPRTLPRLTLFTRFLERKCVDAQNRARYTAPNEHGSRLLIHIIKTAEIKKLLHSSLTQTELILYLSDIVRDLEKPIDVRTGKHTAARLFIKTRQPCFELITASRRENVAFTLPTTTTYLNSDWATLQPFRIMDMSPCDLVTQVYTGSLQYRDKPPTFVIYALDCVALVAKFVVYYRSLYRDGDVDEALQRFVHEEVIVPTLLKDSTALWLRNIYAQQLLTTAPLASHSNTAWDVVNTDALGGDFTGAMVDVQNLKADLNNGSITAHTMLNSLPIGTKGDTFASYYKELCLTTPTPNEMPFAWVDCAKHLSWWNFILLVHSFTPTLPDTVSFKRDILRDVRFWTMMKPWQEISNNLPYRLYIRNKLESMLTYLQQG